MKRFLALSVALALLCTVVGCGTDRRSGIVATTVTKLNDAALKVNQIKESVEKAVETAKNDKENKAIDFKEANEAIAKLKTVGVEMQAEKRDANEIKEALTEEEGKRLKTDYQNPLNEALKKLTKATQELNATLIEAERTHKEEVAALRTKLREAEGEFGAIMR